MGKRLSYLLGDLGGKCIRGKTNNPTPNIAVTDSCAGAPSTRRLAEGGDPLLGCAPAAPQEPAADRH